MVSKLSLVAIAFAVLGCAFAEQFSYDGYKLLNLFPKDQEQADVLSELELNDDFDLWNRAKTTEEHAKVMLSPTGLEKYTKLFDKANIRYEIVVENVQDLIEVQKRSMKKSANSKNIVGRYVRYAEIQSYIDNVVDANPSLASSYIAGRTFENRNLKVLVLKTRTSQRRIWLECGIHAREWVTPATCVYMIDKLISEYNVGNAQTVAILNYFEIHILPIVNPDGYEYTHTTVRLWRKNRKINSGSSCVGVDLNRNWGFQWLTGGSSTAPCNDLFAGPSADSELETKAIQNALRAYEGTWDAFFDIHAFGQWWFTPYGYSRILPENYAEQLDKAMLGANATQSVYGTKWLSGSSANILYIGSGGSEDWTYGVLKIPYSYSLELRPGQTGADSNFGFTLPEDRAPRAGEETWIGMKAFLNAIRK